MVDHPHSKPHNPSSSRDLWLRIGKRLQTRRVQLGLDAEFVARKLGVPRATYAEFEAGLAKTPSVLLGDLAGLLAVPVVWFFQDESVERSAAAETAATAAQPSIFTVATASEREESLLAYFRGMDFDTQQYLLSIARGLSQGLAAGDD